MTVLPTSTNDGQRVPSGALALSIGAKPVALRAERVSTAVVVMMAWPDCGVAGLAHVALPGSSPLNSNLGTGEPEVLTVEAALPELLNQLTQAATQTMGAVPSTETLKVWLVGGAQLFAFGGGHSTLNVGTRNVETVHAWLANRGLTLAGEAIGGNRGRHVVYDAQQHVVLVTPLGAAPFQL